MNNRRICTSFHRTLYHSSSWKSSSATEGKMTTSEVAMMWSHCLSKNLYSIKRMIYIHNSFSIWIFGILNSFIMPINDIIRCSQWPLSPRVRLRPHGGKPLNVLSHCVLMEIVCRRHEEQRPTQRKTGNVQVSCVQPWTELNWAGHKQHCSCWTLSFKSFKNFKAVPWCSSQMYMSYFLQSQIIMQNSQKSLIVVSLRGFQSIDPECFPKANDHYQHRDFWLEAGSC